VYQIKLPNFYPVKTSIAEELLRLNLSGNNNNREQKPAELKHKNDLSNIVVQPKKNDSLSLESQIRN